MTMKKPKIIQSKHNPDKYFEVVELKTGDTYEIDGYLIVAEYDCCILLRTIERIPKDVFDRFVEVGFK